MRGKDNTPNNDDDLGDIFGHDVKYEARDFRVKKKFSAWHRPRKQYVREEQWCSAINELIEKIDFDGRALRYIGLPGNELFDLRTIHEIVCKPQDLRLRFLGFNNAEGLENDEGFELNLSTVEVRNLAGVDGLSKVMPDDFRTLGTQNSMAWNNAEQFGHFDVVNVDLCDGIFTSKPGATSDSYYDAIKEIISFQSKRAEPWLLFLTTRVGSNAVHETTLESLRACVSDNLHTCTLFAEAAKRFLKLNSVDDVNRLLDEPKGFSDIFCAGISKWLIGLGISAKWKVSVKNFFNYTVYPESEYPDLVSAVFEFAPIVTPVEDRLGLAKRRIRKAAQTPSECALAAAMVPVVANIVDVDRYLEDNPESMQLYIDKSAVLFEKARYHTVDYLEWLRTNNR